MRRILVTGGAGFIGSCFVRRQLRLNSRDEILTVDKLTYSGSLESLGEATSNCRHHFQNVDICDASAISNLVQAWCPTAIVHCAAETHVDRSIDDPMSFVQANVVGTGTLLEATRHYWRGLEAEQRGAFRFLHVSTDEVFGSSTGEMFSETTPYDPNSPYAASKAASDHFVRAYFRTYGLPTMVTHCSNNFGPYQYPEKLIPLVIRNALQGKRLPVYGDGLQERDWIYVDDHCEALECVLRTGLPGQTYNIGSGVTHTNLFVVQEICRIVDSLPIDIPERPSKRLIEHVADRPGHDRRYSVNPHKIQSALHWSSRSCFISSLEETVNWYQRNQPWAEHVTAGKYHGQRLGLA